MENEKTEISSETLEGNDSCVSEEINLEEIPEDTVESSENSEPETDYELLAKNDMQTLASLFPELRGKNSILELDNPIRYAQLRDLGLSEKEAYLATSKRRSYHDNRAHLRSAVPKGASGPASSMTQAELDSARELFGNMSDAEIQKLYKKVTK